MRLLLTLGLGEVWRSAGRGSLPVAGQRRPRLLSFQWDSLLPGDRAVVAAPGAALARGFVRRRPPVAVGRWLITWLLLRFMFAAGWAKLASQDPVWRDLSALDYHSSRSRCRRRLPTTRISCPPA